MKRFSWWMLLLTLLATALTSSLGLWQLSRSDQKTAMAAQMAERMNQPPLSLSDVVSLADKAYWEHRSVRLKGVWQPQHSIFLDNRPMDGRTGFWLLTPLKVEGKEESVVVQRGWVPRNFKDRTALPIIDTPSGVVELRGHLASHVAQLLELGEAQRTQIRQNLDVSSFAMETGLRILPMVVIQDGPDDPGLKRQWPSVDTGVQKHHGYAFQWFGLSTLWVILYVWFQFIAPRKRAAPLRADGS